MIDDTESIDGDFTKLLEATNEKSELDEFDAKLFETAIVGKNSPSGFQ